MNIIQKHEEIKRERMHKLAAEIRQVSEKAKSNTKYDEKLKSLLREYSRTSQFKLKL